MSRLNLTLVQAFLDVVELGSFSAAAERAGLSQPAVSLQLRKLEHHYKVALVERVGKRVQPTAAGAAFLNFARQMDDLSAAADNEMAQYASESMGRVRIGAGATACIYLLPQVLKQLNKQFPLLDLTVSTGNTNDFVKAVEANTIDVALVTLPATSRALDVSPLLEEEFVAIAPPGTDLPETVDRETMIGLPLILFEPGGSTRRIADEWLSRRPGAPEPLMSLGSVEAIKELVSAGLGCSILPATAVRTSRPGPPLIVRSLQPRLHRTLAVIIRKDKKLYRGLRETLRALKALLVQGMPGC